VRRSRSRRSRTCGDGRVGITTEFRRHSGGRPRLGGTPVVDETVAAGCHATGGGPVSATDCHAYVQDQRNRDLAAIFGRYVPVSAITRPQGRVDLELPPFMVIPSQRTSDHSQSRRHSAATISSMTGVPPGRGRPPEQPWGSVLLPTRPPPHALIRASRWTAREAGPCLRSASGTSRERRAKPQLNDQVDTTCLTGAGDAWRRLTKCPSAFRGTRCRACTTARAI